MLGVGCRVSGVGLRCRCQMSDVGCQVSWVSGLESRLLGLRYRCQMSDAGLGSQVLVLGLGCQVSGVVCRVQGVRCQVSGDLCRDDTNTNSGL